MAKISALLFAIITIALVSNIIATTDETNPSNDVNILKQLIGEWHLIATINHNIEVEPLMCVTRNMKQYEDEDSLLTSVKTIFNGNSQIGYFVTKVHGSDLHETSMLDTETIKSGFRFKIYDDLGLLVLYDVVESQPYTIYSSEILVKKNILQSFEMIAKKHNWHVQYVNFELCHTQNENKNLADKKLTKKLSGKWNLVSLICPNGNSDECVDSPIEIQIIDDTWESFGNENHQGTNDHTRFKVFNSKVYEVDNTKSKPSVYHLRFFNKNTEVMLQNDDKSECTEIWSRNATIPEKSYKNYKKIADEQNWELISITQ